MHYCAPCGIGSIPAWAGEPDIGRVRYVRIRVYPRVGGGTITGWSVAAPFKGLSPRGRGNPIHWSPWVMYIRSIPAWAGEPGESARGSSPATVYPRVGGGTGDRHSEPCHECGLSPRGRGNPIIIHTKGPDSGSIPAWAGEPSTNRWASATSAVYPRVGGGTASWKTENSSSGGLSPRGRGNPNSDTWHMSITGSIPAWAGEPPPRPARRS